MGFISGLALVLLTLVGYSSGSVLGATGRDPTPRILDLLIVVVLWIAALATRSTLGKWGAIAIWLAIGLVVGLALARFRMGTYPKAEPVDTGPGAWNAWKVFARRMGNFQSRVLMAFIYFVIVLPFGLGVRLLSDPLRIKRAKVDTNWYAKDLQIKPSIEEARGQF